jgi:hypothetical protein
MKPIAVTSVRDAQQRMPGDLRPDDPVHVRRVLWTITTKVGKQCPDHCLLALRADGELLHYKDTNDRAQPWTAPSEGTTIDPGDWVRTADGVEAFVFDTDHLTDENNEEYNPVLGDEDFWSESTNMEAKVRWGFGSDTEIAYFSLAAIERMQTPQGRDDYRALLAPSLTLKKNKKRKAEEAALEEEIAGLERQLATKTKSLKKKIKSLEQKRSAIHWEWKQLDCNAGCDFVAGKWGVPTDQPKVADWTRPSA